MSLGIFQRKQEKRLKKTPAKISFFFFFKHFEQLVWNQTLRDVYPEPGQEQLSQGFL